MAAPTIQPNAIRSYQTRRAPTLNLNISCKPKANIDCYSAWKIDPLSRAGESHLTLEQLLHCRRTWILKATPILAGESDAQIQADFSDGAGSSGGQRMAQFAGDPVHRAGGGAVWRGRPLGHGGVWQIQANAAAAGASAQTRDTQPRYVQSCFPRARPAGIRASVPALPVGLREGERYQSHRRRGNR